MTSRRQILETLAALPVIGVIVDLAMTFVAAIGETIRTPSDKVPFVDATDALPGALKAFSAGLLLYAVIGGLVSLFVEPPSRVAALQGMLDAPSDMEQRVMLFMLYAGFAFVIYYLVSALKWRILSPLAVVVLSFHAAAFLLPLRGLGEALVAIVTSGIWRLFEETGDMRDLEMLPTMMLLVQAIFIVPALMIAHQFFLVWMGRAYAVRMLVMLPVLLAAGFASAFGAGWFLRMSAQVPEKVISALSLLS